MPKLSRKHNMKKSSTTAIRIITTFVITLLALLLERSVQKAYLSSDIYEAFQSHGIYYLMISLLITLLLWRVETSKQPSSKTVKVLAVLIIFGASFFFSNRIELWINSKTQKGEINQNYSVQLEGISWGEIGIRDLATGEIDRMKVEAEDYNGLRENDTISLAFKKGIFGFRHSPSIHR